MKNLKVVFFMMWLFATMSVANAQVDYLTAKPLADVISTSLQPVKNGNKIPIITWGGDILPILAEQEGIFANNNLSINLFKEDDFKKQVEMCLRGEIPAIRGTLAMVNAAAEVFKKNGTDLVVVFTHSTSQGGDWLVLRENKTINNVTTIGAQLYGPHMDYIANIFTNNGRFGSIQIKWLQNLTVSERLGGKVVDPVTAFQTDPSLDAVMCISPDGKMLTSGDKVGTGTDNSVKGAKKAFSTKTANKIIYDVYAFRKDYYDAHTAEIQKFVNALFIADEKLKDFRKSKNAKYNQLIAKGADFFSLSQADVEGMLSDADFLGYNGNVSFFTEVGTTRNFKTLNSEITVALKKIGILKTNPNVLSANWNYSELKDGLISASAVPVVEKHFDQNKVATLVEHSRSLESKSWQEDETILFYLEIYFEPDKSDFSWKNRMSDFDLAIKISETYGGSLVAIDGHTDHGGINIAKKAGSSQQEITQIKDQLRNLGLERAKKARDSFYALCKEKGIKLDESRFIVTSSGGENPKYKVPRTEEQWAENFRVVFIIRQVETSKFNPSAY